jgi:septum site-determining protein MinC
MVLAAQPNSSPLAIFELKSASLSVVALVLRTTDLAALSQAMSAQFGSNPELFSHDPVVIDLSQLPSKNFQLDDAAVVPFGPLMALLRSYHLQPVAVRGGTPEQMQAAAAVCLSEAPPALAESELITKATKAAASKKQLASAEVLAFGAPSHVPTLVIHKPLRSGQQVYAKNGDLIVMAAVNFGAEVLADGNIHVYGPLRGKAVAGVKGYQEARIYSTCMEPELVSIAGTYRTTETPLPANVLGRPAQIRLVAGRLVFEPLLGTN